MNGREALSLIKKEPLHPDLVLTGVTVPEMTGVDLAREVLTMRPDSESLKCNLDFWSRGSHTGSLPVIHTLAFLLAQPPFAW
jgi:CheY-like chemotaxis protein